MNIAVENRNSGLYGRSVWLTLLLTVGPVVCVAQAPVFTAYPIPNCVNGICTPFAITSGPDGNIWFTEYQSNKVGKVTTLGVVTEFPFGPLPPNYPSGITRGPDNNLWVAESTDGVVRRMTPSGAITDFPANDPYGITSGPDGNLWFTINSAIGRITPLGVITVFAAPGIPFAITSGPDGNLWFTTDVLPSSIGRITTSGVFTEFPMPTTSGGVSTGITAGADGNLWFTEYFANRIGRITPAGVITEFSIPTPNVAPEGIVSGPDGALWFTESLGAIGRITSAGAITEFPVPFSSQPNQIALGPDGNLWFTDYLGQIVKVTLPPVNPLNPPMPVPSSLFMLCTLAALMMWWGWRALNMRAAGRWGGR